MSSLEFDVLKSKNTKSKKTVKKPSHVPHFEGLTNPFFNTEDTKNNNSVVSINSTNRSGDSNEVLEMLRKEKPSLLEQNVKMVKVGNHGFKPPIMKKEAIPGKLKGEGTFRTPEKKKCSLDNCIPCNADRCGACLNCFDISRHNKCVRQQCPRLNKKLKHKPVVGNGASRPVQSSKGSSVGHFKGLTGDSSMGSYSGLNIGPTSGQTKGSTSSLTKGSTGGLNVGSYSDLNLGSYGDLNMGSYSGLNIGPTSGLIKGFTSSLTKGSTSSLTKGSTSGLSMDPTSGQSKGSTSGQTKGSTSGQTKGSTSGLTKGSTSGLNMGSTSGIGEGTAMGKSMNSAGGQISGCTSGLSGVHNSTKYRCGDCGKIFSYLGNLTNHTKNGCSPAAKKIRCPSPNCNVEITKKGLARHLKTHSSNMKNCSMCSKSFKTELKLQEHMKTHKVKTCSICEKQFRRPFLFKKHKREAHCGTVETRKVIKRCSECGKVFNRPWRLKKHLEDKHGAEESDVSKKLVKCKHCDEELESDKALKIHLHKHHVQLAHRCEICEKYFFTSKAFRKHIKYHEEPVGDNNNVVDSTKEVEVGSNKVVLGGDVLIDGGDGLLQGDVVPGVDVGGVSGEAVYNGHHDTHSQLFCHANGQVTDDPSSILAALAGQGDVFVL